MTKNPGLPSLINRYRPSLFVLASQIAATTVNAAAKFIESGPEEVHPFVILYVRMLITGLGCTCYLWHVPSSSKSHNLFGTPDVRGLIVLRALGGVCGATGFFFSMIYLSLSEATALNFLGPLGALIVTRYLSFATVQWTDCIGAGGALLGVVLIAQPEEVFSTIHIAHDVSENGQGHLKGLGFGILGVCGGIIALTSIRRIGIRAHPLTSVNAFAWSLMTVSGIALLGTPGIIWPKSAFVWGWLIYIGISGFVMEYLLTLGISNDSSSAATLMIYSQIVWTIAADRALFHITINSWALCGTAAIISSLLLVTIIGETKETHLVIFADSVIDAEECTEILTLEEQISPFGEIEIS